MKNNQINSYLFSKKINNNFKLVPFKISANDIGNTKYLPAVGKEWKNSVYSYNSNNTMNYPIYDLHINSLIKGYFSSYFNAKFAGQKYISRKSKRKSINKILVSKAEIKHTNSKAIITIYVYNREKIILLKKIKQLKILLHNVLTIRNQMFLFLSFLTKGQTINKSSINNVLGALLNKGQDSALKGSFAKKEFPLRHLCLEISTSFALIRKYMLKLNLNQSKFEENFLSRLSLYISKYYGKKVEFNIVNLKSIAFNGDIFTQILTTKIKKDRTDPIVHMNDLLSKIILPKINRTVEKSRLIKSVDFGALDNKYKNLNLSAIINKDNLELHQDSLNGLLNNLYFNTTSEKESTIQQNSSPDQNSYMKIRDILLDSIKYKNMGGAKLIVKGRLTRRFRADRALYKLKWKGGLKNVDSAFKGISTVLFRGYMDSNVEKSILTSKRRIGSFAVTSWFSGK